MTIAMGSSSKEWPMRRILAVFFITSVVMLLTFDAAQWYADNSALPRYCENPADTVQHVREILSSQVLEIEDSKRPYVVAAKLIFLVPRADAEPIPAYLERLRSRIAETCRFRR